MLSDKRINEIAGPMDYFDRRVFARAIEREAAAPLIEQIKEDEALMRKAAKVISWQCFGDCRAFGDDYIQKPSEVIEAIRQRLEAKK